MASAAVAQFVGLYVLVVSAVFLLRRDEYVAFAYEFAEDRALRYVVAFFELGAGLAVILFLAGWTTGYAAVITVFGVMLVMEAVFLLVASTDQVQQLIAFLDRAWYWTGAGVLTLLIGAYLALAGSGLV